MRRAAAVVLLTLAFCLPAALPAALPTAFPAALPAAFPAALPALADCTTPELPVVGCVVPGPTATPAPTTAPSPTSSPSAQPTPTAAPTPNPTPAAPTPEPVVATAPAPVLVAGPPAPAEPLPQPQAPQLAPAPPAAPAAAVRPAALTEAATARSPLPGVVASSFALVAFGLLTLPLLLGFLAGLRPAIAAPTRSTTAPTPPPGGTVSPSSPSQRTRLWAGLGVLAAAAVVGGLGWYKLSGEPLLNRQIPFLASAGIVVVLLSVLGGSLIIAEQLRGDQQRIGDLEDAVRALTEALAPVIEAPARRIPEPEGSLSG